MTWTHDDGRHTVTDEGGHVDLERVHGWLARAYWSEGIPRETVERAVRGSLCFSLYDGEEQVGFARVVTDRATFAYLCDVVVAEKHRGCGLGEWLVACVMAHPDLQGLRRFTLATRDAHGLYARFGFTPPAHPEILMEIARPGLYVQRPT